MSFPLLSNATIIHAVSNGNWSDLETWDQNKLPEASDTVIINGFSVFLDNETGIDSVGRIEIYNYSNGEDSELKVSNQSTLSILNDLVVISYNSDSDEGTRVKIEEHATLNVFGNVFFERDIENDSENEIQLFVSDNAAINIIGDFNFDYKNSNLQVEEIHEIKLINKAILNVGGNTFFNVNGGKEFNMELKNESQVILFGNLNMVMTGGINFLVKPDDKSSLLINGNLNMTNSGGIESFRLGSPSIVESTLTINGDVSLNSSVENSPAVIAYKGENSNIFIKGNVTMNAVSDEDIKISTLEHSTFSLGGNIIRPSSYGSLEMDNSSQLIFNGEDPQIIPPSNLVNSGSDLLCYTNFSLENTSGETIVLQGAVRILNNFHLTNGIIKSSEAAPIILEQNGIITGASSSSFIDGPIIKKGTTKGMPFTFPLGNENTYAPLTISEISDSMAQFTASYYSAPPPFGTNLGLGVSSLNQSGYWELNKSDNTPDPDVTLHWTDAEEQNISNLAGLIVTGWNTSISEWENFGNGETTGGTGAGESGTVTNRLSSDPPPFGITYFAIGLTIQTDLEEVNIKEENSINLFPNPVNDFIQLEKLTVKGTDATIEIFDQVGKRLFSNQINFSDNTFEISTNELNIQKSGTYFMRITTQGESQLLKFIKIN